ncbi:MAG TPA: prolipoprotein diacylglyceryl transferase [Patescibacteria group bacterium]
MSLYGLLIGIAIVIGIEYFNHINTVIPKTKLNFFTYGLIIVSLIGARIYHVADSWHYYSHNLSQIINTRAGGLGIYGALIAGFLFILIFSLINRLNFQKILSQIITIVPLGQAIGRWGNYINTEGFGIPTYIDIGQYVPPQFRPLRFSSFAYFHPVWLYESLLDLFLFLFLISRKDKTNNFPFYLIVYGIIRFLMEFLRWDTWNYSGIKIAQVISLLAVFMGIILTLYNYRPKKGKNTPLSI